MGRYDKLELLFPVKKKITGNINIIKKKPLNNINVKSKDVYTEKFYLNEDSLKLRIYYEGDNNTVSALIKDFSHFFKVGLNQMVFSKNHNKCYINMKTNNNNLHIPGNIIKKINELY